MIENPGGGGTALPCRRPWPWVNHGGVEPKQKLWLPCFTTELCLKIFWFKSVSGFLQQFFL